MRKSFNFKQFQDQFEVQKVEVGGIDFSVWKIQLKACKNPNIEYIYYKELNVEIRVS